MKTYVVDFNNFTSPILKIQNNDGIRLSNNLRRTTKINLSKDQLFTDSGWILEEMEKIEYTTIESRENEYEIRLS